MGELVSGFLLNRTTTLSANPENGFSQKLASLADIQTPFIFWVCHDWYFHGIPSTAYAAFSWLFITAVAAA